MSQIGQAEKQDTAEDQPADEVLLRAAYTQASCITEQGVVQFSVFVTRAPATKGTLNNERQPIQEEAPEAKRSGPVEGRYKPPEPCPICMEGFGGADGMPRTCRKCGNNFHQGCLAEWARKEQQIKWEQKPWMLKSQFESGSCPCCRSSKGHDKSRRWKK
ncbi:unnamed protein product [Symbiodinium microadriaticum]|nr:unnamed protein product [Symbiodinium microadriaticum]CAE7538868.1 unnamed protein product [Symbiodinium sp. KB8]